MLHTKNTYILKLLLNVVTAGTEALVTLDNNFFVCLCQRCIPPVSSATLLHLPLTHHYVEVL
jgi:enoyl reductase-like protein